MPVRYAHAEKCSVNTWGCVGIKADVGDGSANARLDFDGAFDLRLGCVRGWIRNMANSEMAKAFRDFLDAFARNPMAYMKIHEDGTLSFDDDSPFARIAFYNDFDSRLGDMVLAARTGTKAVFFSKEEIAAIYNQASAMFGKNIMDVYTYKIAEVKTANGVRVKYATDGHNMFRIGSGGRVRVLDKINTGWSVFVPVYYKDGKPALVDGKQVFGAGLIDDSDGDLLEIVKKHLNK